RAVARVVPLIAPLPAVAIVAGVVALVVSALLGAAVGRALADWLPLDPSSVDPLEATAGGVGLVAIGLGLRRRKRLAWWMAVSVFVAAAVDQDAVAHPVAAGLAVGCLTVLAGDRRRYRVASDRRAVRPALAVAIVVVTVVVLNAALFDATGPLWAAPIASLGDAIDSLADV